MNKPVCFILHPSSFILPNIEGLTWPKKAHPWSWSLPALPREQVGPFLLLGLAKDADKEQIDARGPTAIKLVRGRLLKVPLEDVNWAREMLKDRESRVQADAASLNSDTIDGTLRKLARRYSGKPASGGNVWQPLDNEKALADYTPPVEMPDAEAIRAGLQPPEVPEELSGVFVLLERLAHAPLDPWTCPPAAAGRHEGEVFP